MNDTSRSSTAPRSRLGWLPLVVIALGAIGAVAIWTVPQMHQYRILQSVSLGVLVALLLALWILFLSRWSALWRLSPLLLAALFLAILRFEGFSADMLPLFSWRWEVSAEERVERPEAPAELASGAPGAGEPGEAAPEIAARKPVAPPVGPEDWPRFLGPDGNSVLRGRSLARDWEARPPKELWQRNVGAGWSTFAVAGDHAYLLEQHGSEEMVVCYQALSGEVIWTHASPHDYNDVIAGRGPRSTPAIAGERLLTLGGTGHLECLDRATGKRLWHRDVVKESGGKVPEWGYSASPLVHKGLVIAPAGGGVERSEEKPPENFGVSLVAYRLADGELAWKSGVDGRGYASPFVATLAGREQVVSFNKEGLAGHDPSSGERLWSSPWEPKFPNCAQPLVVGDDRLLVTSGYGAGCELLEFSVKDDKISPLSIYKNKRFKAKFANSPIYEGHVYGLDDGILVCLDLATGKRRWKGGRYGNGHVLLVEDVLLVTSERGEVCLVEPTTEAHRELARFQGVEGRHWPGAALAGSRLYLRSDREVRVWELPLR